MFSKFILFVLIGVTLAIPDNKGPNQHDAHHTTITTPLGKIQGSLLTTRLGKQIYAFRGIRYAKAPINELRFQPPVPIDKWKGIYNATEDGVICPQPNDNSPLNLIVSEDCLLLNVYSTKLPTGNDNPKSPVLIYFHAGGYYSLTGASSLYGPQYLMDQEIVLITINYRLGSLGFLSTGKKESPGNNGFKDQVEALKWVKNNVAAFGGNPNSVTIGGYSAGGASVTLHLVSPLSQGLFHKAIIMSGSSYGNWPVPMNQSNLAKKQAQLVGCPDDNLDNIFKCLRSKSAKELGDSLPGFKEFGNDPVIIWSAVIEKDFGQPRFLTEHPVKLILEGKFAKVPILLGITADEFAGRAFTVLDNSSLQEEINTNFKKVAPISFLYERNSENSKRISENLKEFYFGNKPIDNSTLRQLAEIFADGTIGFGVNRAAKLLADKSNESVYYYRFSFKGRYSHFYLPGSNNVPYGVVHHDDLLYLFRVSLFPEFKLNDPEIKTVAKMTTMWGNFVKTGNPIPEANDKLDNTNWDRFCLKNQKYMDIGNKLVIQQKLYDNRYKEWETLFPLKNIH